MAGKGEVRFRLVLDSKEFQSGLKAAGQQAQAFGNDLAGKLGKAGDALKAFGPMGAGAAIGLGLVTTAATAVGAALISVTKGAAEYADNIIALRTNTELSASTLQKLEIAAKLGNTSLEALAAVTNKLQRGIAAGDEDFKRLGLSLDSLRKMSPDQQLKATATAILNIKDPTQRAAAEFAVLGKSGNQVRGALEAIASGATDMKGELSDAAIDGAGGLADQMDLLDVAMERVKNQLGAAIASSPEVKRAFDDITESIANIAEQIAKAMPKIVAFVDALVSISRASVKGIMAGGGPLQIVEAFQREFLESKLRGAKADFRKNMGLDAPGPAKTGTFHGADPKAAAAAAAAKRALEDLNKLREHTATEWDKFYDTLQKEESNLTNWVKKEAQARTDLVVKGLAEKGKAIADQKTAEEKMMAAMMEDSQKVGEYEQGHDARVDAAFQMKIYRVGELANAFQSLGQIVGGVFGSILGGLGSITQGIGNAVASIRQMKTAGGGLGGMLGKASGALGLAGAAFSVGQAVWGGLKSLFGGKSKEEKEAEQAKIKDTISQLSGLMEKAKALKMQNLQGGVAGLAAIFDHLGTKTDVTGERFRRLEAFGMDLFRKLKAEGMSTAEAFDALGPSLDAALAAAKANGQELGGTFGQLAQFRQLVQDNAGLVSAVDGLNKLVTAIGLTRDSFATVRPEMMAFYDEMIGKGFTADQAIGEIAPTLFAIREAARAGRIEVDETTKALIAQAEAGGHFDNLKDPMKELVEVQKAMLELWAAIAQMQGVTLPASLREYIATLHQAQSAQAGIATGGGGSGVTQPGKYEVDWPESPGEPGHGASGYSGILGRGPLPGGGTPLVGHPGEEAYLGPPGGNGGISGGMVNLTIVNSMDGIEFSRVQTGLLRKNKGGIGSQTARYAQRG